MKKVEPDLVKGIRALPSFPVVLVTAGRNIMSAAAFHFYSFEPPSVMVGIKPENYTCELVESQGEFGINIPRADQIALIRSCGSVSGRDCDDKYGRAGVTPFDGNRIKSSLIRECPVNIECEVVHRIQFRGSHQWFVGEVRSVHVDSDYAQDQALMYWSRAYRSVGAILEKA